MLVRRDSISLANQYPILIYLAMNSIAIPTAAATTQSITIINPSSNSSTTITVTHIIFYISCAFNSHDPQRVLRQMMNLCRHIYSRGLVDGSGSDVTIKAFGKDYLLHRIILYQNPYFSVLLEGPWKESGQKAIELKFDDENITRDAFEIALGRLYGRLDEYILPNRVLNLLATASFLDLQDLCEMCVEVILRDIKDDTVVHYLTFATTHFYGSHSEKITESCFTYLCREGYDNNKLKAAFLTLPVEWLKKIIEKYGLL
ncbi:3141_t:CDS:2 [Entrophospora sp. SA101]|nr:3141_t:CDS:2 [Entrophospora sp. SA101]